MQFEVQEKGPVLRLVEVVVSGAAVNKEESKNYAQLRKQAKVPGFRPGKVPRRVLQRMYGQRVSVDAREVLIRDHLQDILDGIEDVLHLSPWEVTEPKTDDGGFRFEVQVEVMPSFELTDYNGLNAEQPRIVIDEGEIDDKLVQLQEQNATFEPVEDRTVVAAGDFVAIDVEGLDKATELSTKDQTIEVGNNDLLPGLSELLDGVTIGEELLLETNLPDYYPPAPELAGEAIKLQVIARSISAKVLPELDDDLALDTGEAESLEELKSKLREELEAKQGKEAEGAGRRSLIESLRDANPFELPMQYVETRTLQRVEARLNMFAKQGLEIEKDSPLVARLVDDMRPIVSQEVHAEFVLDAIAKAEEIEISEENVRDHIAKEAESSGMPLAQLYRLYNDPNIRRMLREELLRDKVVSFLLESANIVEVDPPAPAQVEAADTDAEDADAEATEETEAGEE